MTVVPSGGLAVMAGRKSPLDSLDFFPTPPWATRALMHYVVRRMGKGESCWEPACGEGHMAEVLREDYDTLVASDVHDYGKGYEVGSFVGLGPDVARWPLEGRPDWIITNPPFNLALEFADRAMEEARRGWALLVRTSWLEGQERYRRLFERHPPMTVALFSERVAMVKGRWDPDASTATSYCWVVWARNFVGTQLIWIPPGAKSVFTDPQDVKRFGT